MVNETIKEAEILFKEAITGNYQSRSRTLSS